MNKEKYRDDWWSTMNPVYMAKCHCGKKVLKIRYLDSWYTLCSVCYRDSFPNIPYDQLTAYVAALPNYEIKEFVKALAPYSDIEVVKNLLDSVLIEEVERALDGK